MNKLRQRLWHFVSCRLSIRQALSGDRCPCHARKTGVIQT